MTFTQLEYVVAVDSCRHFAKAAARCFVTQPTLSMQIQKLEDELGMKIFDRSKQPVVPTEAGIDLIGGARKILSERSHLLDTVQVRKGQLAGELRMGIIPTLAPSLLPLFVRDFHDRYPGVKLVVSELMTDVILQRLREGSIDTGILVTPLQDAGIQEQPLFYEELVAYVSPRYKAYDKEYVLAKDIDPEKLWLMEEGHCFRSQIVNLCELRKSSEHSSHFEYEVGSIETLRRMVDLNDGITILPELSTLDLSLEQREQIRHFRSPAPMREVSMVTHREVVKKRMVGALRDEIVAALPDKIRANERMNLIPLNR